MTVQANPSPQQWMQALESVGDKINPSSVVSSVSVSLIRSEDSTDAVWWLEGRITYEDGSKTTII